jgi:hypothetical protein
LKKIKTTPTAFWSGGRLKQTTVTTSCSCLPACRHLNRSCCCCCNPTAFCCSGRSLPPVETTAGYYRHFKQRQESNMLFLTMLNPTIYFRKIEEKYIKNSHTWAGGPKSFALRTFVCVGFEKFTRSSAMLQASLERKFFLRRPFDAPHLSPKFSLHPAP